MESPVQMTACMVHPALPGQLTQRSQTPCSSAETRTGFRLANGFLAVTISRQDGLLTAVENRLTGQTFRLQGDQCGLAWHRDDEARRTWRSGGSGQFQARIQDAPDQVELRLEQPWSGGRIAVVYRLRRDWFWVERHLEINPGGGPPPALDHLEYGRVSVPGLAERVLELGLYDRPRLLSGGRGGLFTGVGWWFYTVDGQGVYGNDTDGFPLQGPFMGEPFLVGVFQDEPGDSFPGWAWYKAYLQVKKEQEDRQGWYTSWNGGWGQWGLNIEDPATRPYIDLAQRLGLKMLLVGGGEVGYGTPRYMELAKTHAEAQANIAALREAGLVWGCLENGGRREGWLDESAMREAAAVLEQSPALGLRAYCFDFFGAPNTYRAHRAVTDYFRACRRILDYTECHLGMAEYGPQFQREVLVNHPTDIGHDSSRFSADWCTFLNFRRSRAEFQHRWNGLVPDYGMYYFLTHYANWGHPRTYADPEPQQLTYSPPAYCGLAYNFHDFHGFRASVAAAAAFSPFYVFGHLDLKMPAAEVDFARRFLAWVGDNAEVLRRGRVCLEDAGACVVSKVRDGRGAIFLVNYGPGTRVFRLFSALGAAGRVRQVFPQADSQARDWPAGQDLTVTVRGESVAILDVNRGLRGCPPPDETRFPADVVWTSMAAGEAAGVFDLPDLAADLAAAADPSLPQDIVSLEQEGREYKNAGCGRLSPEFIAAHGMRDGKLVETWKMAPWAYGDRIWLVYRPAVIYRAGQDLPRLTVNGAAIPLVPRLNYLDGNACTLFFADVTAAARHPGRNTLSLSGLREAAPGYAGLYCAAERK